VACIYDNWQSIFEDSPDAVNALRRNGRSPADANQKLQYSSDAGQCAAGKKLRGDERSTPAGTLANHL
jgi:hypothetical protein